MTLVTFPLSKGIIIEVQRYPKASDSSLRAWNAADELLLEHVSNYETLESPIILHDLFGYLSCHLNQHSPSIVVTYNSQEKSIAENLKEYGLHQTPFIPVLNEFRPSSFAVLKIPKSIELFELYLSKLANAMRDDATVLCGFMTKYFTASWLKIASKYFDDVSQTKAKKKARLIVLRRPKKVSPEIIRSFEDEGQEWQQYLGVFSSGRLDPASRFLIDNIEVSEGEITALDLGCGNGVLARQLQSKNAQTKLILVDDNSLAVASAKLNIEGDQRSECSSDLSPIENDSVDLVVCNPPFHFEYEINTDVAHKMFEDAARVLKDDGVFWVVANNNLPYKSEILKHFKGCEVKAQNRKFIVYRCENPNK